MGRSASEGESTSNRLPTVTASCDPCEVEVEDEVRVRANASDPDDDPLSYRLERTARALHRVDVAEKRGVRCESQ